MSKTEALVMGGYAATALLGIATVCIYYGYAKAKGEEFDPRAWVIASIGWPFSLIAVAVFGIGKLLSKIGSGIYARRKAKWLAKQPKPEQTPYRSGK